RDLAAQTWMGYAKVADPVPASSPGVDPTGCIDWIFSLTFRRQFEGSTMDAKTPADKKTGTVTVGNKNWDLPIYDGTVGPAVLDISKLYGESGMFTYDPGFTSTASCESKITYIDGDEGILLYRGYPIEQL